MHLYESPLQLTSHPWRQKIGVHNRPRYIRIRVITGRVITRRDCNMNKYYYNHTQHQMFGTKNKAIQQIKIEDIALSNASSFESNTLKHYFFDKTAIIQIQFCYWTKSNAFTNRSWFSCRLISGTMKLLSIVGPTRQLCI